MKCVHCGKDTCPTFGGVLVHLDTGDDWCEGFGDDKPYSACRNEFCDHNPRAAVP